jgi:hypothetical protein
MSPQITPSMRKAFPDIERVIFYILSLSRDLPVWVGDLLVSMLASQYPVMFEKEEYLKQTKIQAKSINREEPFVDASELNKAIVACLFESKYLPIKGLTIDGQLTFGFDFQLFTPETFYKDFQECFDTSTGRLGLSTFGKYEIVTPFSVFRCFLGFRQANLDINLGHILDAADFVSCLFNSGVNPLPLESTMAILYNHEVASMELQKSRFLISAKRGGVTFLNHIKVLLRYHLTFWKLFIDRSLFEFRMPFSLFENLFLEMRVSIWFFQVKILDMFGYIRSIEEEITKHIMEILPYEVEWLPEMVIQAIAIGLKYEEEAAGCFFGQCREFLHLYFTMKLHPRCFFNKTSVVVDLKGNTGGSKKECRWESKEFGVEFRIAPDVIFCPGRTPGVGIPCGTKDSFKAAIDLCLSLHLNWEKTITESLLLNEICFDLWNIFCVFRVKILDMKKFFVAFVDRARDQMTELNDLSRMPTFAKLPNFMMGMEMIGLGRGLNSRFDGETQDEKKMMAGNYQKYAVTDNLGQQGIHGQDLILIQLYLNTLSRTKYQWDFGKTPDLPKTAWIGKIPLDGVKFNLLDYVPSFLEKKALMVADSELEFTHRLKGLSRTFNTINQNFDLFTTGPESVSIDIFQLLGDANINGLDGKSRILWKSFCHALVESSIPETYKEIKKDLYRYYTVNSSEQCKMRESVMIKTPGYAMGTGESMGGDLSSLKELILGCTIPLPARELVELQHKFLELCKRAVSENPQYLTSLKHHISTESSDKQILVEFLVGTIDGISMETLFKQKDVIIDHASIFGGKAVDSWKQPFSVLSKLIVHGPLGLSTRGLIVQQILTVLNEKLKIGMKNPNHKNKKFLDFKELDVKMKITDPKPLFEALQKISQKYNLGLVDFDSLVKEALLETGVTKNQAQMMFDLMTGSRTTLRDVLVPILFPYDKPEETKDLGAVFDGEGRKASIEYPLWRNSTLAECVEQGGKQEDLVDLVLSKLGKPLKSEVESVCSKNSGTQFLNMWKFLDDKFRYSFEIPSNLQNVIEGVKNSTEKQTSILAASWKVDSFEEFLNRVKKLSGNS